MTVCNNNSSKIYVEPSLFQKEKKIHFVLRCMKQSVRIHSEGTFSKYRISANSFRGNYSFLELGVRKLFKGGNYSREETIVFLLFRG